ncbi:hypothetical protein L3X38_032614 [Prunus dulcis]|uniref:Endonuclease/exonuclease/phosphatase domain-containing protein n=1 Tax=Prunus dulcis TaxID=3755 RepID=A0AAD4YV41_PRUDU|nr:hypothetical protein L3X38_032614 [Prunus dulcis]
MNYVHAVVPVGLSGGLCMFWKEMAQVVLLKYAGFFFIEVVIKDEEHGMTWQFCAVYASTDARVLRSQWQILSERIEWCQDACLVMGDFNDIMDVIEKSAGVPRIERSLEDFCGFVANSRLLDLGYVDHPFTWRNRHQDWGIMERLDRGFGNVAWMARYPKEEVHHVIIAGPDHAMLLLHSHGST